MIEGYRPKVFKLAAEGDPDLAELASVVEELFPESDPLGAVIIV